MEKLTPHGIVPAIVTPFRAGDERIDFAAWEQIIDLMISSGADGIFAAGGQGEFFSLDAEERVVALRFCKQHVGRRMPVYGNVGCVTTRESVRLAQAAQAEGIDYAVVITPYYLKPSAAELIEHYVEICRAVTIPVLAYNIPERSGVDLTTEAVKAIAARVENFIGLKDSSGRLEMLPELIAIGRERPFYVFIGRDHMILPALKLGCAGAVTACANVAPSLFTNLYRAFVDGRLEEAARLQALVDPLRQAFNLYTFPAVIKEAMEMIGYPAGPCRKPVGALPAESRAKLAAVLEILRSEKCLPEAAATVRA
jgi:4-hydroxy-tetrahydrodipicolinate synthase